MRVRLVVIAIALVVLAFAGLRHDDVRSSEPNGASDASSQLAAQPAPDVDPPAIVRAAVTAPATAQAHAACEPRGHMRHAHGVSTARRQAPVAPDYDFSRPRAFPLLI